MALSAEQANQKRFETAQKLFAIKREYTRLRRDTQSFWDNVEDYVDDDIIDPEAGGQQPFHDAEEAALVNRDFWKGVQACGALLHAFGDEDAQAVLDLTGEAVEDADRVDNLFRKVI